MTDPLDLDGAEAVLVAHQRHRGGCLCGWAELGKSHPGHQVAMLRELLRAILGEGERQYGHDCKEGWVWEPRGINYASHMRQVWVSKPEPIKWADRPSDGRGLRNTQARIKRAEGGK